MSKIETYIFETLYSKDKNNKIKTWKLSVEKYENYSEIVTLYGYNRLFETRRQINSGKNLYKSNATTHYEQAILEAKSKWTKKKEIEQYTNNNTFDNLDDNSNDTLVDNMRALKHEAKVKT